MKHQFSIGPRLLNFEGTKKQSTKLAEAWRDKNMPNEKVIFIKRVSIRRRKTLLVKMDRK